MIKAASTYVNIRQRLHPGLLDAMVRGGAQAIEIFGFRGHFDYQDRGHVRELLSWFKGTGTMLHSLHAPMFYDTEPWTRGPMEPVNIIETDRKRQIEAMDEIKRAIEVAELLPFKFLVQHLGNSNEEFDPRKFDAAMTSVEHLRAFAKPLGVTLLLENIPNEISTPERLQELVTTAHFHDVGFCFDTGHANLMSTVRQAFEVMQARIRSTHVHDNDRVRDSHLGIGEGNSDWTECAALLRSAPHVPPILLELENEDEGAGERKLAQSFAKFAEADEKAVEEEARAARS